MSGILYIVSTPIGNLEDITLRAIRIFKEVDLIAAEDTRVTKKLLNHLNINKQLISYFEYNKLERGEYLINLLKEGKNIALVCDAGTPCISDSGYLLIDKAYKNDIKVVSIPGPSSLTASLSISGVNTDRFIFLGFLKKKSSKRKKELERYKNEDKALVFFESPHRILQTLMDIKQIFQESFIVITRELTKKFEEVIRGSPDEVIEYLKSKKILGEFCVIIKNMEK